MSTARPVSVITGASSGIGASLARVFARGGHEVVLVARRETRLNQLADEIAATGKPRPIVVIADLEKADVADTLRTALAQHNVEPRYFVNNAGFGLVGTADTLDLGEQLRMIDVNVRALTDLSFAFVDSLERHRGGLLNVASIAGFVPGPGSAVYYATKAFVVSLSEALSRELSPRNIRVTCLCPGPVPTEFAARAGGKADRASSVFGQSAEAVAEAGYAGLIAGKRRVVPGLINKIMTAVMRFVPRDTQLAIVDRRQTRRRAASAS